MIMQKWQVVRYIDTLYTLYTNPKDSVYNGTSADYIDFRSNGSAYTSINNSKDTSVYTFNDSAMVLQEYALFYQVLHLTDSTLVLYDPSFVLPTHSHLAYLITLKR